MGSEPESITFRCKKAGYGTPVGIRKPVGVSGRGEKDVLGAVADLDGDGWSDLAVFSCSSDGVHQTRARLGSEDSGLADATADTAKYTAHAYQRTPSDLSRSGLSKFCPECGKDGGQGGQVPVSWVRRT